MDKNFSYNKLLLMFFATFLFGEEAGYRFVNEITKTEIMDMEITTDYDAGGFSYMSNFSGRILTEYLGIKDGTHHLKQTWSNIISTNRRNDELVINHKAQKLNGTQYTIFADSSGEFTREGLDDNSRQMEESNQAFMYFSSQGNILHPFGDDSLRHVGDTWAIVTKEHLEDFPGFESADADLNDKTVFTFDKIKKKKGKNIAIISGRQKLIMKMTSQTWDETWKMDIVGDLKVNIEYNMTDNKPLKIRLRGNIKGNGIDLQDDSSISFNQNMDMRCRIKTK